MYYKDSEDYEITDMYVNLNGPWIFKKKMEQF